LNERRNILQESLAAIERLQTRLAASENALHAPIAIIGVGCRYPGGVDSPEALWRLLRDGVDAVSTVPADRWDIDAYYDADPKAPGKMVTRRGGFLTQVDQFDPQYFGISPREATTMDPQQRLLLETATEALESAGLATDRLVGSATGVFIGITTSDYARLLGAGGPGSSDVYSATGGALNAAAGRISFTFGFQGPCVAVDTACSSSLVAVHLACQSLRTGESRLALAGGVNVILSPDAMVLFSKWGMLAPDGACKTFDAAADGFVRAEGCALIALKRLADAQADGDPILAVIRGSAVNSDGRSSGLTVPNGPAQQAVLRAALASAQLKPTNIDYVEAHGTGTSLGDPIEIEALGAVMAEGRTADRPLAIGSIKTNLGHTEAASGLAGLLKTVMALRHEAIPPHLHFRTPNPGIPWADYPFKVPTQLTPWPRGGSVRRAGVSSFGFSGTNAHIVLEEAPEAPTSAETRRDGALLVPLSARDDNGLRDAARQLANRITAGGPPPVLADIAATLAMGRSHHSRRAVFLADSTADLEQKLRSLADGQMSAAVAEGTVRAGQRAKVAFLFTGQGSQYVGMGRQLYDTEPVFRKQIDRAAAVLAPLLPRPLLDVMFSADPADNTISQTAYTQPALFAIEYALAELWRSWGVTPSIVAGHSVGEYVAACVAGVFSFEDGLALIAERGCLMQALPAGGGMAAVFAPEAQIAGKLASFGGALSIAAVNGPEETVVSGDADALSRLLADLAAGGIKSKSLDVSHAFHSARLDPMLDGLQQRAAAVKHSVPRISLVSNVTGEVFPGGTGPDPRYWRRHTREAVRFASCINALSAAGATVLVEVGPHPTLLALAARAIPDAKWSAVASLRRGRDERREMLAGAAALHVRGAPIQWDALMAADGGRRIPLPTYPFQRSRYWVSASAAGKRRNQAAHPLLGEEQQSPHPGAQFLAEISRDEPSFLAQHVVLGEVLLPGTAYLEMAVAAARARADATGAIVVSDFVVDAPLRLEADTNYSLHTEIGAEVDGAAPFTIRSKEPAGASWRVHARGTLRRRAGPGAVDSVGAIRARCATNVDVAGYYQKLEAVGLAYGPMFRSVRSLVLGKGESAGVLEVTDTDIAHYSLHPALVDAAFHLIGAVLLGEAPKTERVYVPIGIDEVRVTGRASARLQAAARVRDAQSDPGVRTADVTLEDDEGRPVAELIGLRLREISPESLARALAIPAGMAAHSFRVSWRPITAATASAPQSVVLLSDSPLWEAALRDNGAKVVRLSSHEGLAAALAGSPDSWVVDCRALDADASIGVTQAAERNYLRVLSLAQAISSSGAAAKLCVVTRGAHIVEPGEDVNLAHATLPGLARTLDAELEKSRVMRLDLDTTGAPDGKILLAALTASANDEFEIAVRNKTLFAARLQDRASPQTRPPAGAEDREVLRIRERGVLDNLQVQREKRRAPAAGEVEIRVRAAGLNFRDVLNALGMYPGDAGPLGSECSGVVVAVGAGVQHIKPGDEVIAFAVDSMASHVTAPATLVVRKPANIGFADAITLPNAYLTAAQALIVAAGLKRGQRVLIHAAAGGVGLAAVRLAKRVGAEVIATAGSAEKRAIVKSEGAAHVFDSRSLAFADEVMRVTDGAGVDVVLNSLAGDFIPAGMRTLARGGCFAEIGKSGIWTAERAAREAPGIRYIVVDLGEAIRQDPAAVRTMFETLVADVSSGALRPLPVRSFPLPDSVAAFRYMAAARHVGKIALIPDADARDALSLRKDGTYVVSGGLGGLGLAAAEWLAKKGAGEVVLLARREPGEAERAQLERLRETGARVTVAQCDVGDRDSLQRVWRDVLASRSVRGVLHCAGSLADAPFAQQNAQRFAAVAHAKILGAWNLHELSADQPLDFFVLYSSASALLGSPGQANYAASNSFLDALATYRNAHGLPGTSLGWGAWAQVGMAARLPEALRTRLERLGMGFLTPADAFAHLERALLGSEPYTAVVSMDTARASSASPRIGPLLSETRGRVQAGGASAAAAGAGAGAQSLRARIRAAVPNRRKLVLRDFVREQTVQVLGIARVEDLDVNESLRQFGLDSLMAVELRNVLSRAVEQPLSATLTFDHPTVVALVEHLGIVAFQEEFGSNAPTAAAEPVLEVEVTVEQTAITNEVLEEMSQDDVAAALASRLERMTRGQS
jgi:acyl transferase domain-containing protein/NADPH:quinone reductase-like Zn-dependent oxidoreductase/aryl carrier-like protein